MAELIDGRTDRARQLFAAEDARAPIVVWSPSDSDYGHPLVARFAHMCREMLHTEGQILVEDFDLERLWSIYRWVMTVEVDQPLGRFVFGHCGRGIAESYGADLAGQPITVLARHVHRFYSALFEAAIERREWVLSEHEAPWQVFVETWRRLAVPIVDRRGRVRRFVILAYPQNELRAGLEIVPDAIFIVDEEQKVRFANRAARHLFGSCRERGRVPTLRQLCGVALKTERSAFELHESGAVENSIVRLNFGGRLADDFVVTVSGARQCERAFYVVMLRLAAPR